jgi:hypothetical protein
MEVSLTKFMVLVHEFTHWLGRYTGAIFAEHPQEGKDAQFLGSVVVYTGGSAAEVREIINNDIYAKSGVWDLEKVQIYPVSGLNKSQHNNQTVN